MLFSGTDVEFEKKRLGSVNILVCTPGRLLQHMDENDSFCCDNLQMLIIDEAYRILDLGFQSQVLNLIRKFVNDSGNRNRIYIHIFLNSYLLVSKVS